MSKVAMKRMLLMGVVGFALSMSAAENKTPANTNTVIQADQLLFDYGRMIGVFEGHVEVQDPEIRMTCDKLNVLFDSTNEVKSVTAFGNVRVYHQDKRAESDQAIYMAKQGEIELLGNAKLFRLTDTIMGRKITFWLDNDKMKCEPATLIIHPAGNEKDASFLPVLPSAKPVTGRKRDEDAEFMRGNLNGDR